MEGAFQVLIADDNIEFCHELGHFIAAERGLAVAGYAYDGETVLDHVKRTKPDVLVLDIVMPKLDGLGVLQALRHGEDKPKILILSAFDQDDLITRTLELGASYYIMKPFDMSTLILRIRQVLAPKEMTESLRLEQRRQKLEREVDYHITRLGVPPHYKGYKYLREAIAMVVEDVNLLTRVTKGLYPAIARRHDSTAGKVERAIRHAVESTWTSGNLEAIEEIFAYTYGASTGKPTNSSFIARLADQVRMELRLS